MIISLCGFREGRRMRFRSDFSLECEKKPSKSLKRHFSILHCIYCNHLLSFHFLLCHPNISLVLLSLLKYLQHVFRVRQAIKNCLCIAIFLWFFLRPQHSCIIHSLVSSALFSTPIRVFENVICMAISLALWWKREVEFHHLIRADVDLISLFHSGVDKLRDDIIYSLGCNSLFNHSHSQPG